MIPVIDALCGAVLLLTVLIAILAIVCTVLLYRVSRLEGKTIDAFARLLGKEKAATRRQSGKRRKEKYLSK